MCWCCLMVTTCHKWTFKYFPCSVCSKHKFVETVNRIKAVQRNLILSNFLLQCLLYRTDQAQDVKKIEKFHSQLMRLMVAKESRSAAMETDWIAENNMSAPVIFHWKKISLGFERILGQKMLLCTELDWWQAWSIFSPLPQDSTLENQKNTSFQLKAFIYFWELNKKLFLHIGYAKKTSKYFKFPVL